LPKEWFIVTGGSGFIGSALCDYLLKKYTDIGLINVTKHTYAMSPKSIEFLEKNPRYKIVFMDITETAEFYGILSKKRVKKIFHLAAETHVDRSFMYPKDFLTSNLLGTISILEAIRHMKEKPLLYYMSTDEVFGEKLEGFSKETEPLTPRNPYVASKVAAEAYCHTWHHCYNVPVIIGRSMNNFGPRQHPEKLIAKIITKCLSNEPFNLYHGASVRGWIYSYDTADAVDTILEKGEVGQIYHIPSTVYKTVPEVCKDITKLMGKEELFAGYKGHRLKDDARYALDTTKMRTELKWKPKTGWKEGLMKTIDWYKTHEDFWKGVYSP
jgi:dTDP-glucose 4,6-dehydratase